MRGCAVFQFYFKVILRDIHEKKFFMILWHCWSQLKSEHFSVDFSRVRFSWRISVWSWIVWPGLQHRLNKTHCLTHSPGADIVPSFHSVWMVAKMSPPSQLQKLPGHLSTNVFISSNVTFTKIFVFFLNFMYLVCYCAVLRSNFTQRRNFISGNFVLNWDWL